MYGTNTLELHGSIHLSPEKNEKLNQYRKLEDFVEHDGAKENARTHISAGLNTATNVVLNIYKVIPHVNRARTISAAELEEITGECKKLIVVLASMGISGFVNLERTLGMRGDRDNYDFRKFRLSEKKPGDIRSLALNVEPELLMRLREQVREEQEITGCPALAIDGPSGKNIILEFYEWLQNIAKQYYFPFFDRNKK